MSLRRLVGTILLSQACGPSMHAQDAPLADPRLKFAEAFEARTFEADGAGLGYRLLKPIDFDANNQGNAATYPLVVFLHGAGERGSDNIRQLVHGGRNFASEELRRRHPAFIIAPQCPDGKKWVEVPWDGKTHSAPAEAGESMKSVFGLVESLQEEFPIDASRIYAVGLSMGGFGVWDVLGRKPELLAAAVPICGGGDTEQAGSMKSTPLWAFHGAADPVVIPERSRQMIAALEAAGGRPIYTEYEDVGHDCWTATFDNRLVWDWLFAQRRED